MRARFLIIRDIWDGLRSQPARTTLALATIAVGIGVLTALAGALAGLNRRAAEITAGFGADVIAALPRPDAADGAGLTPRALAILRGGIAADAVSAVRRYRDQRLAEHERADILAADHRLVSVRGWHITAGRGFDPRDVSRASRCCVVTRALADALRVRLDDSITVRGLPLRVIGIVAPGELPGVDPRLAGGERFLLVPETVPPLWLNTPKAPSGNYDAAFVRAGTADAVPALLRRAQELTHEQAIDWVSADVLLEGIRKLRWTIGLGVGAVAGLCLVLGVTLLTGLMLARVRERVPEIGLRRALGATPADIAALFVGEALAVSIGAAVLGVVTAAAALASPPVQRLPVPILLHAGAWLVPAVGAILTAAAAALWPALLAARIAPHEALRSD